MSRLSPVESRPADRPVRPYAGIDIGLGVDLAYEDKAPYEFTGAMKNLVFDLKPAAAHDDEQALHEHASIHAVASRAPRGGWTAPLAKNGGSLRHPLRLAGRN